MTPGLPHWGPDSPTQAASGPVGAEGVAVGGGGVECRNPDLGDYRSPFPPELNPNPAEKVQRVREESQRDRKREAETLRS